MFAFIRKELTAGITLLHLNGSLLVSSYSPFLHCAQSEKAKSKAPLLQSTARFPLHLADWALK